VSDDQKPVEQETETVAAAAPDEVPGAADMFEADLQRSLLRSLAQARVTTRDGSVIILDDPDPITLNKSFLDRALEMIAKFSGSLPPKEKVLEIAGRLYDTYVASINIPQIPDIVEGMLDNMAKRALLHLIGQFYDRIAKQQG
jgi:hypothetical protein